MTSSPSSIQWGSSGRRPRFGDWAYGVSLAQRKINPHVWTGLFRVQTQGFSTTPLLTPAPKTLGTNRTMKRKTHFFRILLSCGALFVLAFGLKGNAEVESGLPSDSLLLKKLYGKVDPAGTSYTRSPKPEEAELGIKDDLTYAITYKTRIGLRGRPLLLVIAAAPTYLKEGDQRGYRNVFFLQQMGKDWVPVDSVISGPENRLSTGRGYEIVSLGPDQVVLVSTFSSTAKQHYELTQTFELLEVGKLSKLFSLVLEYDNAAFVASSPNRPCKIEHYVQTYDIERTYNEWFGICVKRTDYSYSKGCKEVLALPPKDQQFEYKNGNYVKESLSR